MRRNIVPNMIKSGGRNFTGRFLGGVVGFAFGVLVFMPPMVRSVMDNWEANQPADGPYDRADSIVLRPYFTDGRDHRPGQIAAVGIFAFSLLWPLPYVSVALFGLVGLLSVNAVIANGVNQDIARASRVGAAPVVIVQEIAETGDVANQGAAGFSELPAIPEGTAFDTLRSVLLMGLVNRTLQTQGAGQKIEDMQKLVATGKATNEDLEAIVEELPAMALARPFGDYQSVHRKLTELICLIEGGKTDDDLQDEYREFFATLVAVSTHPVAATQRRNSNLQAREKATPNIYVRPTYLRPVVPAFV